MSFFETFAEQGCLVIERLFDPLLIDSIRDEYERQYASFDPDNLPLHMSVGDRRLHLPLQLHGPLLDPALYAHPLLMVMLSTILELPFLIDNVNCVTALPRAAEQKIHRDHPPIFGARPELTATLPAYSVTVGIPLIDLDHATGTTKLFPRSMAADSDADGKSPEFEDELCPFLSRGGCFIMDYRLWHRGMANRSERNRPILYIVYAREWFTDVVNFKKHGRLLIDAADVRKIPDEHRPMFRRLAAKGLHDMSIKQLMGELR